MKEGRMALNAVYVPKKANEPNNVTAPLPEAVKAEVTPPEAANTAASQTDDLISKVTQFETEKSPVGKSEDEIDSILFSDKELRAKLDSIQDPVLREQFVSMRKSMMRGVNDKFQDLANVRKELEAFKSAHSNRTRFSANSVEELLQNQEFVAEAQRISGKTSELAQDDTLSETAKGEISRLKAEVESMKQAVVQQNGAQAQAEWNKYHESLSGRYKNYDRSRVDTVANDLASGKMKATPEHLYKVIYHDENVQKAYELGRREALSKLEEKKSASSIDGVNAVRNESIKQEAGEDNRSFLQRIIANRLSGSAPK
jgi:hypothetical protein